MKRITMILLALLLAVCLPVIAVGVQNIPSERLLPRLNDGAQLLTEDQAEALLAQLDEISQRLEFDVAVVTVDALPAGYTVQEYADDFYDQNGFGQGSGRDGCLLLISMEERDWYISTCGYGITALTDSRIDKIGEEMIDWGLSDGDYASAFARYAALCEKYVAQARQSGSQSGEGVLREEPSAGERPREETPWGLLLLASLAVGALLAFIPVSVMKADLKTVRGQRDAENYVIGHSLRLNRNRDVFLYRNVTRTAKPKEESSGSHHGGGSSIHTSSSGTSHGGGGGKF